MAGYLLGIDAGTESVRAGIFDGHGRCAGFGTSANTTLFSRPGWAEQDPREWEGAVVEAVRAALGASRIDPAAVEAVGVDGTTCTVVLLDGDGAPLGNALMWMDIRASAEAKEIAATRDQALEYVGFGNVSAEWFPCKLLWLRRNEPALYDQAKILFEQTDWLVWLLTGEPTLNLNTASMRWFFNARRGGFPLSLYRKIGLESALEKVPSRIVKIGERAGALTRSMAERTGLRAGIPVAGGGGDAFVAMIGVNALTPGRLALVTGSSQLQLATVPSAVHAPGLFGSFPDAVVEGLEVIEAGQVSTGSVLRWFTKNFIGAELAADASRRGVSAYDLLNERAARIAPGSEGLVVLDHWQGNRTPWTDPASRGVIRGLTLSHTPAHLFRAIMEGVAYGTQVVLDLMDRNRVAIDEIVACGGATSSDLWMQITADVTGKTITIPEEAQAAALGSAAAASVAAGIYASLKEAAQEMVRPARVFEPDLGAHGRYLAYVDHYVATYEALKEDSHRLVSAIEDC